MLNPSAMNLISINTAWQIGIKTYWKSSSMARMARNIPYGCNDHCAPKGAVVIADTEAEKADR